MVIRGLQGMTQTFDVLIVGGGSAGAVLANRLSEDGTRRIILLEAGSAYSPNLYPPDLANADIVGGPDGHDWGYVCATGIGDRSIRALRGKTLGGSSAVNAAVAIRARAADFAKWSALGIQGWSFDDVLASYKAVENSPDGDDHYRGRWSATHPHPTTGRTDALAQRFHRCGGQSGLAAAAKPKPTVRVPR